MREPVLLSLQMQFVSIRRVDFENWLLHENEFQTGNEEKEKVNDDKERSFDCPTIVFNALTENGK